MALVIKFDMSGRICLGLCKILLISLRFVEPAGDIPGAVCNVTSYIMSSKDETVMKSLGAYIADCLKLRMHFLREPGGNSD